ncbi:hypothetical protein ACVWYH_006717 [Bradyrhizobium sp. GM24.11]|jgi:hypothetical protein
MQDHGNQKPRRFGTLSAVAIADANVATLAAAIDVAVTSAAWETLPRKPATALVIVTG